MNIKEESINKTLIPIIVAVILVIGGLIAAMINIFPEIVNIIDKKKHGLELVDVNVITEKEEVEKFYEREILVDQEVMGYLENNFDKYEGHYKGYWYFPIIEFKFRNTSDDPHIINSIDFNFIKKTTKNHKEQFSSIPFSSPYHIIIDTSIGVSRDRINVSESVDPKSTKRVIVIVASTFSGYKTYLNYEMKSEINYNRDEKFVETNVLTIIPPLSFAENEKINDPFISN